jgi:hypothetical protein
MRFMAIFLALGLVMGAPLAPTSLINKAEAQATSSTTEEQTLQAQIVALAQAGDTEGIKTLIAQQVTQGKAGMVAKVAKAIALSGAMLVRTDPTGAAALVNAAVLIASDSSVVAADSTVTSDVAQSAAVAVSNLWDSSGASVNITSGAPVLVGSDPARLAALSSIVTTVKSSSNSSLASDFYTSAPPGGKKGFDAVTVQNNQTGGTGGTGQPGGTASTNTTTRTTNTPLVVTPTITTTVEVPVVPEPNPNQSGGSPT